MRCTTISEITSSAPTSQKYSLLVRMWPPMDGLGILMPKGPSVMKVISLIRIWMMVPNASVTMARIAAGSITQMGICRWKNSTPATYEPMPNSPAWPSDTWPV
ncbi:hypothetical protein G6F68_017979 [Rhizopus microsporus]|nr:hypothetical protein G6F68_017979 [Rhizopus microsporus]